ncbi:MAG: alpha/beta fold hydrolase [Hyphomonadaceae bacterium]
MRRLFAVPAFLALFAACAANPSPAPMAPPAPPPVIAYAPYEFIPMSGAKVEAQRGTFQVPENRANPDSRMIDLSFVRFPSTSPNPGPPIIYLAGGPGGSGSGTARGPRFPLFMALREVADVIAFDQRGTGLSQRPPVCTAPSAPTVETPLTRDAIIAFYRTELPHCFDWWEENGVDIDGYTTLESAHDIDDLRRALGVEKVNLWGISYGSHLGLAVMKYHPQSVARAVLAGIEGLDETVKLPSETDAYFARVQAVIDADPAAKAAYPDLAGLMRRVHQKLNQTPASASFTPQGASAPVTLTFDGFAVQLLASGMVSDPGSVRRLPLFYAALDAGKYTQAAQILYGQFFDGPPTFAGMPEAMDLASGISPARMARLNKEFETGLLGDALNFPMPHVAGIRPQIDLGADFRAPFESDVPTLFISGTLDGRTYPAEAAATVAGFANGARLIVENGGHNIYEADPRIGEAVLTWFKGAGVPAMIRFDPPKIAAP